MNNNPKNKNEKKKRKTAVIFGLPTSKFGPLPHSSSDQYANEMQMSRSVNAMPISPSLR